MSVKISVISEYKYLSPLFIPTNNYAGGPIWGLLNEGGREVSGQSSCVGYPLGLWGTPGGWGIPSRSWGEEFINTIFTRNIVNDSLEFSWNIFCASDF